MDSADYRQLEECEQQRWSDVRAALAWLIEHRCPPTHIATLAFECGYSVRDVRALLETQK